MSKLNESRVLRTPNFTGTSDESLAAANTWLSIISCLRRIPTTVIDYNNQLTILQNLQTEIQELLGDIKNSSNTVVTNNDSIPTMVPPEYSEDCNDVDCPELTESQIKDIKRLSGIRETIKTKENQIKGKLPK